MGMGGDVVLLCLACGTAGLVFTVKGIQNLFRRRWRPGSSYAAVGLFFLLVMAAVALPAFVRGRNVSCGGNACINNLRMIDSGKEQAALANRWDDWVDGDNPTNKALVNAYIKGNTTPRCPEGGTYSYNRLNRNPTCSKYRADDVSTHAHHMPGRMAPVQLLPMSVEGSPSGAEGSDSGWE